METAKELVDNYIIENGFYCIEEHYNNTNNWKNRFNDALQNLSTHKRNEWEKYDYFKTLANDYFGIGDTELIYKDMLDV